MSTRTHLLTTCAVWLVASIACAGNTTIIDDNFDSYANQSAFDAVWQPDMGDGQTPLGFPTGFLVPDAGNPLFIPPNDDPPDIQGTGVNIRQNINEHAGPTMVNGMTLDQLNLVPTATEAIRLSTDIFDDAVGNKKLTVALRNDNIDRSPDFGCQCGLNFLEMGFWNALVFDPTLPGEPVSDQPTRGYAYRMALFSTPGDPLVRDPNWQYFEINPAFAVELVCVNAAGWCAV